MNNTKVMIVDDSPFQIALLRDGLIENGFDVVGEAKYLEEVISEVERVKPDVVTMDMTIPGTDGFECTRAIHEFDSNIKVIIVSSMMDDELVSTAKKNNVSAYIQKPVDIDELSMLIGRVVEDDDSFLALKDLYPNAFKESIVNIFNRLTKTMVEVNDDLSSDSMICSEGISIVMGITGKYFGRLILDMSFDTASKLAEKLLGRAHKDEEEVVNIVSEVANMFAGNACSIINKKDKIFGLRVSPPTAFHGEDINISKTNLDDGYTGKVKTEFGQLLINVGFRKGEKTWMSTL